MKNIPFLKISLQLTIISLLSTQFVLSQAEKKDGTPLALRGVWEAISEPQFGMPAAPRTFYLISDSEYYSRTLKTQGIRGMAESGTWYKEIKGADGKPYLESPRHSIQIDSSSKPAKIDLSFETKSGEKIYKKGIYQIEGEKLTISISQAGGERPATFIDPGIGGFVMKLVRYAPKR